MRLMNHRCSPRISLARARYTLAIAVLALIATRLLVALIAPGALAIERLLLALLPLVTLVLRYSFSRR